ncbi:MAG: DNA pilot protein [Microviridae sp.]|nr:MAG: DNA pilot protein [Microviridae sp.]
MPIPVAAAMLGSAAIGAAGSLFSGSQSAKFAEDSYKHRYQWQVKDLQKAGLNPMLAIGNAAPNVPQPTYPNLGEAAVRGAAAGSSAAMQNKLTEAQLTNLAFDSDLKNNQSQVAANSAASIDIDNQMKMNQLPYSADRARMDMEKLSAEIENLNHVAQNSGLDNLLKSQDVEFSRLDREQRQALAKIEIAYKSYMAEQARLQIPEARADAAFWEKAGIYGKAASAIKSMIPGIGNINVGGTKNVILPKK